MPGLKEIQDKLDRGEDLTDEEMKDVMSEPNYDGDSNVSLDDVSDEDFDKIMDDEKEEDDEKESSESSEDTETPDAEDDKEGDDADTGEKKDTDTSDSSKKDDDAQSGGEEDEKQSLVKVQVQLDKPEGQEDLTSLSKHEKALYWELKRERRLRQEAESERDTLKFKKIKEESKEGEEDKDGDMDPDDFVSVKDIDKIIEKKLGKIQSSSESSKGMTPQLESYLKMCDEKASDIYDDYEEVIELSSELIESSPAAQRLVAQALAKGENPAIKMYHLIKSDPQFGKLLPLAQGRIKDRGGPRKKKSSESTEDKVKKATEAEEKLEKNKKKPKTSAHHSGNDETGKDISMSKIMNMSDHEFALLPKNTREKFLQRFG